MSKIKRKCHGKKKNDDFKNKSKVMWAYNKKNFQDMRKGKKNSRRILIVEYQSKLKKIQKKNSGVKLSKLN